MISKQYEKGLEKCKGFKEWMRTQQDTLNEQYLTVLQHEVKAYLGTVSYTHLSLGACRYISLWI